MSLRILVSFTLLAFGLGHAGIAADAGKDAFDPPSYGADRYEAIWKRSPFIVETVVAGPPDAFATKYSMVGLASIGGKPVAFLMEVGKDPSKGRVSVSLGMPNPDGLELVSANMDSDLRSSTIEIKQGGNKATLHFDPTIVPPTGPVGMTPGAPIPGAVPPPPAMIPQLPSPRMPVINGQIGSPMPPMGGQPAPTPPRRIIRPAPINIK